VGSEEEIAGVSAEIEPCASLRGENEKEREKERMKRG
jgi:hypothetical protein